MRQVNFLLFTLCFILVALAYYVQVISDAPSCYLCIIQRSIFTVLAGSFLLCAWQQPKKTGLLIYTVFNLLLVTIGLIASGRQIWLQNQPKGQYALCMPTLTSSMNHPVLQFLNQRGGHQCAEISHSFFGLSFPVWAFLFFSFLATSLLIMWVVILGRKKI